MAKDQRNVEAITPMEVDFAKWYTDICLKAEMRFYRRSGEAGLDKRASGRYNKSSGAIREKR